MEIQTKKLEMLYDFNQTRPSEGATAGHPIYAPLRQAGYQYNQPVHIGKNCWIGAGVIIMPGVTIGDNVVIGSGSVVTKDISSGVVAVGNPCKVIREITNDDKYYWKLQYEDYKYDDEVN